MAVLSASMLLAAHLGVDWCAWIVYCFLIPLLYHGMLCRKTSVVSALLCGAVWGLIFFGGQLWAVSELLIRYGADRGVPLHGYIIALFLITYCSMHTALWFLVASYLSAYKPFLNFWRLCIWSIASGTFFTLFHRWGFWALGNEYGYFGALYWLPLAQWPWLIAPVNFIGKELFTWCIIAGQMAGTWWLAIRTNKTSRRLFFLILLMYLICIGGAAYYKPVWPDWLFNAVHVRTFYPSPRHPHDCAVHIAQLLDKAHKIYPHANLFFMPESAFPLYFNNHLYLLSWWFCSAPSNTWLIFGGHSYSQKKSYNTAYVAHNEQILFSYDKKCLMPLFEQKPKKKFGILLNKLFPIFFTEEQFFSAGKANESLIANLWCQASIMICCEIFLQTYGKEHYVPGIMMIALVNDGCFNYQYLKKLMELYARVRALDEARPYLYISYLYGTYIDERGALFQLPSI